jgi:hypothetical protein
VGGTGGTDAPPGATTGAGSAKVMQFLELAAAATSMRCACWGCDAVSPEDAAAVALCEARWHDANPGPASECMLDMTIARIECALAAGCDPDALLACDNSEQQEVTCPPAPNEDVLLACYDGILDAGPAPSSGGSAGAGAGPGPVVVVVDPCESDVQLFIACEAFCTAKTDAAQCAGGTYDKDLCLDSCLRTGELAVLESTCSERWDCIQCQLPYLQCDATYTCSGSMGPSCTPTPCNVECMLEF